MSEYASWSIRYYKRIIDGCLDAVDAPRDLVQFVVGYGATGAALVSSGVDKVIFVGSPGVGALVAKTAAETLTPVVLELGGKDPFVVCDDVDVKGVVQTACRGVWQNMGQVRACVLSLSLPSHPPFIPSSRSFPSPRPLALPLLTHASLSLVHPHPSPII